MVDLIILMNTYVNQAIHNDKFCLPWWEVDTWLAILNVIVIDTMLLLRTWAIWRRSRNILICLSVLLVLCIAAASGSTLYESLTVMKVPSPDGIRPCETTYPKPNVFYGLWVSLIVFDFAIVTLTLIKMLPALHPNQPTPFIAQLLRDGVIYFVVIFLASVANVIVITTAPPALATMLVTFYRSITSTLCSRLVLNLRGIISCPIYHEDTTINMDTLVFAGHPGGAAIVKLDTMENVEDSLVETNGEPQRRTNDSRRQIA